MIAEVIEDASTVYINEDATSELPPLSPLLPTWFGKLKITFKLLLLPESIPMLQHKQNSLYLDHD